MNLISAVIFAGALAGQMGTVTWVKVEPNATDSTIGSKFDTAHLIYVDRTIMGEKNPQASRDRHQLLLFLTGTGGNADPNAFCYLAAKLGYHVVNLMYPDEIPATICRMDADPGAFEKFRMAIIAGGQSPHITVRRADSIENRFQKLLLYLRKRRPKEDWGQFLNEDGTIKWESIAVAGQSQGGGHAALIGIKHRVARVICTGAPKDYSLRLKAPAAWYQESSATPKACFFAFNHRQDSRGCSPQAMRKNLVALGLDRFGPPEDVAVQPYPYGHARILMTSFPRVAVAGPNSEGAMTAHTSVIDNDNAERWQLVWAYMLTEPTP